MQNRYTMPIRRSVIRIDTPLDFIIGNIHRNIYSINNKLADYLGDNVKAIFKASKLLNFEQDD